MSASATGDVEVAAGMVRQAEDLEAGRRRQSVKDVRPSLARRIGITPSALRHIRKRERKYIPSWLMVSIRQILIEVLIEGVEGELAALEHELAILRTVGADPRSDAFIAARARAAAIQKFLDATIGPV